MIHAYLEITMKVSGVDRAKAGAVYSKYKPRFLATIPGAESKELLLREEDVQVLHGFDSRASAESYLKSALFGDDVVRELKPYLLADPEVRVYERNRTRSSRIRPHHRFRGRRFMPLLSSDVRPDELRDQLRGESS